MDGSAWVILPTYNEAENVEAVVGGIRAAVPAAKILVVDDNSATGRGRSPTGSPTTSCTVRASRASAGPYIAGFARALEHGAAYVVEMDADLSHDPADLPRLIEPATQGADLVLGSRYVHGGGVENWNMQRRVISLAGCEYARRVLGLQIRDLTGGFKCFRAGTLQRIDARTATAQGYAFQVELTWRTLMLGMKIVEVPIRFRERRLGESKMSAQIALEAAWRVPALRYGPRRWRPPLGVDGRPADPLVHEG